MLECVRRTRARDAIADALFHVLFLLGLPLALWTLTGNPIPSRLPSWLDLHLWWAGLQAYPAQALDIVPRVVVDALWIAWAWYSAWFVLGLLWAVLRLPAVTLPHILLRLTPRTTVQALTMGAIALTPTAHTAVAGHPAVAPLPANLHARLRLAAAPAATQTPRPLPPLHALHRAATQNLRVHQVVDGDTLWDLAVRYYGEAEQWHRIYAANADHLQPDGQRLVKPDLILPGWRLTIPHRNPLPAAKPHPTAGTAPNAATRPVDIPPPGTSRAPAPDPATHTADPAPPRTPRAIGWRPPEGGYIGITLIAAIAASAALINTRRRLRPDTTAPLPASTQRIVAVHEAAKRSRTPGTHPQAEATPEFKPQPGVPMLGVHPRTEEEAWYDPGLQNGPLIFTGPGAEDVVRALALSMLGASDLDLDLDSDVSPLGMQVLLIDQDLARDLLDARPQQHLPGWLHLTDTPAAAVASFHAAARRRAASGVDAEDYTASQDEPLTMLIARNDPSLHDSITEACLLDPTASLGAVLLGAAPARPSTTMIAIDGDGTVAQVAGPRAAEVRDVRFYATPRDLATDQFQVLYAARETYREPAIRTKPATHAQDVPAFTETAHEASTAPPTSQATQPDCVVEVSATHVAAPTEPTPLDPHAFAGTTLLIRVLGPIDVLGPAGGVFPARGERTRGILAALAVHTRGLRTPQLADLAWGETAGDSRTQRQTVYAALRRTRDLLRTAAEQHPAATDSAAVEDYILLDSADRYHFDDSQITTDLQLRARLEDQAAQAADQAERLRLLAQAADLYRGPLADGLDDDQRDWLTTTRYEELLHTARLHLRIADIAADTDQATALNRIKQAIDLAPDDEHTTTEAVRLYQRLDHPELARALTRRPAA